ncbi:MAG: hypothetical protein CSB55_06140 [Candidatus Cloacimonadota bacterium]|nr:MAG: hypothetical protein CSB55_06140 [Candidatus Cloacimonadota bacterium]
MKNHILIILLILIASPSFAQTPEWDFIKKTGGGNSDYGNSIAVDDQGNLYITGSFSGNATFGDITLYSEGNDDIFIAKADNNGNWLWAKRAGSSRYDYGKSIAVDDQGNLYITGSFYGNANFGNITLYSAGVSDIFIAKTDNNGNWLWAKRAGGTSYDYGKGIAVDDQGNLYITGYFKGTATFGSTNLTSKGNYDMFIIKSNNEGNFIRVKGAGGTNSDQGNAIAVDNQGNLYVTGIFRGSATFGDITLNSPNFYTDIFITKSDNEGNFIWAKRAGGEDSDYGNSIAVDKQGNSYVTGIFRGSATFGDITLNSPNFYTDIFITKSDNKGNFIWAKRAGGENYDYGNSIAVDDQGNSYITGYFKGTATFGTTVLNYSNEYDIFAAKTDKDGNWLWAKKTGKSENDEGRGIAVDNGGNSYITGHIAEPKNSGKNKSADIGNTDIFIAKLREDDQSLPTEFSTFSLTQSGDDVSVKWVTQTENDLRGFYVLKSETEDFESANKISDLIPASNTSFAHEYVCEDNAVEPNKRYWYWVEAVSLNDNSSFTQSQSILLAEETQPQEEVPEAELTAGIKDVYPNPFNPPVNISFYIDEKSTESNANIEIYNVKGQKVHARNLGKKSEGLHTISWNGNDEDGKECGSGIYFVKFNAGSHRSFKKSIKLK